MCGIFGILQARPFRETELAGMSALLRHRGPDDEGFLLATGDSLLTVGGKDTPGEVFATGAAHLPKQRLADAALPAAGGLMLGHRRLSIVDLSSAGHQPMSYLDRYWIVYNGEVYNHHELRSELRALGYSFQSRTDTEVILAAYDRWGAACLSRFNGMWALAIYDRVEQNLLIARDRFGVKPVYFWASPGRLAFASEIKAFTALPGWQASANQGRLVEYLAWGITDHTEETLFRGVTQLPPGSIAGVRVNAALAGLSQNEAASIDIRPWYEVHASSPRVGSDTAVELRETLTDAVRLRLRADVPVGSCLSGGLDSSTIVCVMHDLLDGQPAEARQRTFTASSSERELDETRHAHAVVDATGVQASYVTPDPQRLFAELDSIVWSQDEPFASTSIFAQWCVFELARRSGVPVMLDGQGADEILCGYGGYVGAYLAELFTRGDYRMVLREMRSMHRRSRVGPARLLGYMAAYLRPDLVQVLGRLDRRSYADQSWLRPAIRPGARVDPIAAHGGRSNSVEGLSVAQLRATNLPMLLRFEDRNSMAFSIEARTPFLDYRVVELCLGLRAEEKIGGGVTKAVMRRAMRGIVPDAVLDRRDKVGFVTAERTWLQGAARAHFRSAISEAIARFDTLLTGELLGQFDALAEGQRTFDARYWRVVNLAHWARAFQIRSS